MQNPISIFRSMLQWFRATRGSQSEQPLTNSSRAKGQAVEALSPEKFREMFGAMLADPETRRAIMRDLMAYFPIQGGTPCTSVTSDGTATANSIAMFTAACNLQSSVITQSGGNVGVGTTAPGTFGGESGQALDVIGSTYADVGVGSSQSSDNVVGDFNFYNTVMGSGDQRIALIRGNRSGANNSGALQFFTRNAGGYVSALYITPPGNVGVGTVAPGTFTGGTITTLDVIGPAAGGFLGIGSSQSADNLVGDLNFYNTAIGSGDQRIAVIRGNCSGANNSGALQFFTRNAGGYVSALYITPPGNVGIGNTNPQARLDITGGMNASGSVVIGGTATKQSANGPEKLSVQSPTATNVGIGVFVVSDPNPLNARFLLDMNGNHEWSSDGTDQTVVLGCTAIGRMNLVGFPMGSSARGGLGIVAWRWSTLTQPVTSSTSDTMFHVKSAAPFVVNGTPVDRVRVEDEICTVNSVDLVNNILNVNRGQEGTTAVAHAATTPVVAIGTEEPQPRILFLNDGGGIAFSDGSNPTDVTLSRPSANQILLQGNLATGRANISLSNGDNPDVGLGGATFVKVAGPTMGFAVTGFAGGSDGRILLLYNTTSQTMTIKYNNTGSAAANRILTLTGADVILRANGQSFATLIYDVDQARWILAATN